VGPNVSKLKALEWKLIHKREEAVRQAAKHLLIEGQ